MPRALLLLLWLKLRAGVRRALRVQGNPKKLVLLLVGVAAIALWLVPTVALAIDQRGEPVAELDLYAPLILAVFTLVSILTSSGENAIAFQPAEVDLLFPGPFTRRQLLAYKLLSGMMASLLGALIFSLIFMRYTGAWLMPFAGIVVTLWFIQFLGTALALVRQIVGDLAYTRARRLAILLAMVAAAAGVAAATRVQAFSDVPQLARTISDSTPGRVLLAPFRVYTSVITSPDLLSFLPRMGLALLLNAALFLLVLTLDTGSLEASIRASERMAERVKRIRSGNMTGPRQGVSVRSRPVTSAWIGGAGPILWRQSTTLQRSGRRWALQVGLMLAVATGIVLMMRRTSSTDAAAGLGLGVLIYVTIVLASMLRFDFRSDLDHIESLKTLPLSPRAVALGEMLLPVMLLSAVQAALVALITWGFHWERSFILVIAAAIPVVNVLLIGVENLMFLLFPARLSNRGVADFSLIGRQMLLFLGKTLILGVIGAAAAGIGLLVHLFTRSPAAAFLIAWAILALACAAVIDAVGRAFRAFDVSADMPS